MSVLGIKLLKSEEVQRSDFQLGKDYPRRPQPTNLMLASSGS